MNPLGIPVVGGVEHWNADTEEGEWMMLWRYAEGDPYRLVRDMYARPVRVVGE